MRRAAHGAAHALRRPSSYFFAHLETSCSLVPPAPIRCLASTTTATLTSTPALFKGIGDVSCIGRGGCYLMVRRNMSGLGEGGDVDTPNRYKEREAMIREAQQMVRKLYKEGFYQDALEVTQRVVDMTDDLFGRKHGVYASALNDQALMLKSIGQLAAATDTYLKALEVYRTAYKGEENVSFAATLHNLGMTFKAMSQQGNSLERVPLLERAEETFQRCVEIREKILPNNHPDLQLARSRLAMVQGQLGGTGKERTEARLRAALDGLVVAVGKEDLNTATAMTNLALFLKLEGKFDEAEELYTTVVYTRKKILGDSHMDTIVAMYNLAELHRAAGRETVAYKIQDDIIAIGEKVEAERLAQEAEAAASECGTTLDGSTVDRPMEEAIKRVGKAMHATQTAGQDEVVVGTWTPGDDAKKGN